MNTQLLSVVSLSTVSLGIVHLGIVGSLSRGKYTVEDVQILCDDNDELLYDDGDTVFTTQRIKL